MYHQVTIVGRLTRDPERQVDSGPVKFGLAANSRRKVDGDWQDATVYFNVAAFGKTGEFVEQYARKGAQVLVVGELNFDPATGRPRSWLNKTSGDPQSSYEINADKVKIMSWNKNDDEGDGQDVGLVAGDSYASVPAIDDIPF